MSESSRNFFASCLSVPVGNSAEPRNHQKAMQRYKEAEVKSNRVFRKVCSTCLYTCLLCEKRQMLFLSKANNQYFISLHNHCHHIPSDK